MWRRAAPVAIQRGAETAVGDEDGLPEAELVTVVKKIKKYFA